MHSWRLTRAELRGGGGEGEELWLGQWSEQKSLAGRAPSCGTQRSSLGFLPGSRINQGLACYSLSLPSWLPPTGSPAPSRVPCKAAATRTFSPSSLALGHPGLFHNHSFCLECLSLWLCQSFLVLLSLLSTCNHIFFFKSVPPNCINFRPREKWVCPQWQENVP
ncbi:unnamed protein product [Rangifer tarandus platyrhynchus]|uniref:Uncharacterized protein n=1 Tax=Rangifer tarandus platyrhynchus TaxID=3082113 RepID=A0AC59Y936_RANTA